METRRDCGGRNMFDLEQEIRRWRRQMGNRLPFRPEAIDELEAHLREAVAQRRAAGAEPQGAWTAALAQLGSPKAVAAEYCKLSTIALWNWLPARVVLGIYGVVVAIAG